MTEKSIKKTKLSQRRRNKMLEESSSSSTKDIIVQREPFDNIRHYNTINVKKYATYKQGNFKNKNMKSFAKKLDLFNLKYTEISSKYSLRPKKKLCVITGLPSMFICPDRKSVV